MLDVGCRVMVDEFEPLRRQAAPVQHVAHLLGHDRRQRFKEINRAEIDERVPLQRDIIPDGADRERRRAHAPRAGELLAAAKTLVVAKRHLVVIELLRLVVQHLLNQATGIERGIWPIAHSAAAIASG